MRRIRTNTPLQALVTLNDTVYLDMARHFAQRLDSVVGGSPDRQVAAGYRWMLYKDIAPGKLGVLMGLYKDAFDRYSGTPGDAAKILGTSDDVRNGTAVKGEAEKAAMVVVCNALLNLDEVITKN